VGFAHWFSEAPPEPYSLRELTTSGHDGLPAVSPDHHRIALASDRDGRSRIWLKELSTGAEQAVTDGDDSLPQFSPDGSALLFVRAENGRQNAYRQALLGGHPLKVMDGVLEACWSPDGESIAFVRQRQPIGNVLAMVPARGGTETRLYESARLLYGARWSPRKSEIVVIEGPPSGKPAGYNLIFINPDSEHPTDPMRRLPVSGPISAPVWTGGGRRLLYAQAGSTLGDYGDPLSRIVLHDLDTARKKTVFFAEGLFPTITQWTLGRATSLGVVAPGSVVFGKTDVLQSLREAPLVDTPTRKPVPRGGRRDRQPVYSPDGEQLLFSSDRTGNLDLWLFDFRREELRRLTDDADQDWDPAFTPDGRSVLWSSDRTGHLEIWSMDLDGGAMKQVTRDGENAENPTATQDRAWIIYSSANPAKSGIWRIRPDGTDAVRLVAGSYTIPETSPDGRWATFRLQEPANRRTLIGVLEVATGKVMPFQVAVPWPAAGAERLVLGRTRWLADGKAFAYLGVDDRKRSGIYVQDYDPDGNTEGTRRALAGFSDDFAVESFALTRDGRYVTMSTKTTEQSIQIAKGVPEVEPVAAKEH
jgi:Tol biopolymer transport system component